MFYFIKKFQILVLVAVLGLSIACYQSFAGKQTVANVQQVIGPTARARMAPYFKKANVSYPPHKIVLIGLKQERRLEVWAHDVEDRRATHHQQPARFRFIRQYTVLAASGRAGPKLREGDRQVPEGFYKIEGLNPNSSFHLSMKLNYPNRFDLKQARVEGRNQPGSNIFIHGSNVSIGCLAMGDAVAEQLFILVADTGRMHVQVLMVPNDLRSTTPLTDMQNQPRWLAGLYRQLAERLNQFPK